LAIEVNMAKRKVVGICHICGKEGPLTFEHIPPESAFNDHPVVIAKFEQMLNAEVGAPIKGRTQQRGAGGYTLCGPCNNKTGHWYGSYFASWCVQGMRILTRSGGEPRLVYPVRTFPLEILKQIVAMFMSANSPEFQAAHPDLVKFVLDPQDRFLNPRYRFFTYYTVSSRLRQIGLTCAIDIERGGTRFMSEITFPPYGYVMTTDSGSPDGRLFEITDFSRFGYREYKELGLKLNVLPIEGIMACDYRTRDEILRDQVAQLDFKRKWEAGRPSL
jgi:hypothetical protein